MRRDLSGGGESDGYELKLGIEVACQLNSTTAGKGAGAINQCISHTCLFNMLEQAMANR